MWGGGGVSGGSGGGGGLDPSALAGYASMGWVDDNYVSKDYFNQLFKVKVAVRVLVTDPSTTPATVISDTSTVRQDLLYPNEVPESTTTTDEETGYVTSTTYSIDSIQVMGGVWTNSYVSALGQNSSGGGGGGGSSSLQGLLDVNIPAELTQANDGQVLMYNYAQNKWINATIQQSGGTVTSITAGTGLSGGIITGSGTIAIDSTYQTYIGHGETAYGWGNHANAGYATQTWVNDQNFLTQSAGDNRYLKIDFFRSLFRAYTSGNTEVTPNAGDTTTIDNIKAMFGFWTNAYISALGQNSSGGGGATDLAAVWESLGRADGDYGTSQINISHLATALSGYATTSDISDMATKTWVGQQGFLTSNSFSALTTNNEKISATIGTTTRTVQAPTIADLGQNPEVASSSSTPATKFAGAKFGATAGLYLTEVYPSVSSPADIPCEYGNMVNILGAGGGQMLAEWCGDYTTGHLYYRSHRDVLGSGGWTPWTKLAFTTDNVASATKLATARTLWGRPFDGTANVSGNMTDVGSITASGNIETSGNIKATKFYLSSTVYFQLDNDGNVQLVGAGLWTNSFLSALGQNSSGGGGATDLAAVWESLGRADGDYGTSQINISHLTTALSGYATTSAISDMATKTWVTNQGYTTNTGTVTSVGMTVPTGFSVSPATITSTGTFAITFASGYSLPTTAKQLNWDTAYGWGDHSLAGYLTSVAFSDLTSHPTTLAGYGITDAKIASGVITLGTNTITPWTTNNHPTTLSGYGITDALGNGTKFWGQTASNGKVSGDILLNGGGSGSGSGIYLYNTGIGWHTNGTGQATFVTYEYNNTRLAYEATYNNTAIFSGKTITTNPDGWRIICGNYGTFWRNDGSDLFLMFTASGEQYGDWNSLRPLQFNIASGLGQMQNGLYIYGANQGDATASGFNALRVGNISLVYDSTNNALKIQKADGTAANLYATGSVSALGMSAGTSAVDAMKFGYLTVNTRLNLPTTIVAGNSPMIVRTASDSDCIYLLNFSGTSKETSSNYYYNQYNNIGLHGTNYNYDETWFIDPDGCARFKRLYLDSSHYLYVSNGTLYYYNGTTSKQVAFTN